MQTSVSDMQPLTRSIVGCHTARRVPIQEQSSTLVTSTAEHERLHNAAQCAGREVREEMFEEVATLLHDLDDGMRPISVMFPYLPTAFHRKRDA